MQYNLIIDEDQRAALAALLAAAGPLPEALEYWVEMLADVPVNEAADPGIGHGFCL